MAIVDKVTDKKLRAAIAQRRLVTFSYHRLARKAEPHDYGINKGKPRLFCYQVGGQSGSGKLPDWRLLEVPEISALEVSDDPFAGPRTMGGSRPIVWDQLFASVSREPDHGNEAGETA